MNLLPKIRSSIATLIAGGRSIFIPRGNPLIHGTVSPAEALRASVVGNCCSRVADHIASVAWGSENRRVNRLLNRPNAFQDRFGLFYSIGFDLMLHGVCYLYRGDKGTQLEYLAPFNPAEVTVKVVDGRPTYKINAIDYTGYIPDGSLTTEDIVHIEDVQTSLGQPLSRRALASGSIRLINDINDSIRDVATNGPVIGLVVKSASPRGEKWSDQAADAIAEKYGSKANSGSNRRGGVIALDGGVDLEAFGPSLEISPEMGKILIREEIKVASAFGLPPFMVGVAASEAKYSNQSAQQSAYYRDLLFPLIERIRLALEYSFKVKITANYTDLFKGDLATMMQLATAGYSAGVIKRSKALEYIGETPAADGSDDVYVKEPTDPNRPDEGLDPNRPRAGDEMETDDGNLATTPEEDD